MFPKEWKARPKTFLSVIAGTQNYINFGTIHISVPDIKDKKKKRTLKDLLCLSLYKLRMQVVLWELNNLKNIAILIPFTEYILRYDKKYDYDSRETGFYDCLTYNSQKPT